MLENSKTAELNMYIFFIIERHLEECSSLLDLLIE